MSIIIGIVIVAFVIGLVTREKGDGVLDTLSSGCGAIIGLIFLGVIIIGVIAFLINK